MPRPLRSRAKDLFSLDNCVSEFAEYEKAKKVAKKVTSNKKEQDKQLQSKVKDAGKKSEAKKSASRLEYEAKLSDGLYNDFKCSDWIKYWQDKALTQGVTYYIPPSRYVVENQIFKRLMKEYPVNDLKTMIDFVWECEHDVYLNKPMMGTWILTKGWEQSVVQGALLWRDGQYKTNDQLKSEKRNGSKRNREWVGEEERSVASTKIKKSSIEY